MNTASVVAPKVSVRDLIALGKPRITFMVLVTTLAGLYIAPGNPPATLVWFTVLGTTLVVAGANALNMYIERDSDALMRRTQNRPLPARRMAPAIALYLGIALGVIAIPILTFGVNPLTGLLGALSLLLYVLAYTPMKRRSTIALLVGAIPGAMPPLMGWTAATGEISADGVGLFFILFLWQLPHFIAISTFRQADYTRAGLKVIPETFGIRTAKNLTVLYTILLVAVSLGLLNFGMGGRLYPGAAYGLGAVFLLLALLGWMSHTQESDARWAKLVFFYSLIYLPLLLLALVVA